MSFIFRTFLPFLFRHPSNSVFQIDLENEISCGTDIIPRVRLISSDGSSKTIVDTPTTNWTSPTSSTASERTSQTTEFPLTSVELEDIVVHYDSDDEEYDGTSKQQIRVAISSAKLPEDVPEVMGRIHSVESMSAVDGPGLRYLVFTQGCSRKCVFCQNRDTWDITEGREDSSKRLSSQIKKCISYLKCNNGGVTLSGGEPLMQPIFTAALFKEVKLMGLTTCLDTTGFGSKKDWDLVLPNTDYVLLCLKSFDPEMYKKITSNSHRAAFAFADELKQRGIKFWLRYVMLPGWTDNEFEYNKIIEFTRSQLSCQGVELLPYHRLGTQKWEKMGHEYPLEGVEPPSREEVITVKQKFIEAGVKVLCSY